MIASPRFEVMLAPTGEFGALESRDLLLALAHESGIPPATLHVLALNPQLLLNLFGEQVAALDGD